MSKFYATTPIYYVNARPHIGHAYCTVLADVFCKYQELMGKKTYLLTGTDEHGQKVMESAEKRGVSPQEHVDEYHVHFKEMCQKVAVDYDDFIRTTEKRHTDVVQRFLEKLYAQGDIYERDYEGWYSVSVEKFWTEKDLVDGKCPETGNEVILLKEKSYFFRMSKYQQRLLDHIEKNPTMIYPNSRKNEVLGFLRKPLEDLCISRPKSRLSWGVELPFDKEFVTYVWFDALLNYVSALEGPLFKEFWESTHHFLGKDILVTHCVYWTTMLLALEIPLPKHFIVTGWWLKNKEKMSKSIGNVVDPLDLTERYGVDVIRYFLMREMSLGQDSSYSEELVLERNNKELANDLGNSLSRVSSLIEKNYEGRLPKLMSMTPGDERVWSDVEAMVMAAQGLLSEFRTKDLVEAVLAQVRQLNKYITDEAPYKILKVDRERAGHILHVALEGLRVCCCLLSPLMPGKMSVAMKALGIDQIEKVHLGVGFLKEGNPVTKISGLFPRYELSEEAKVKSEAASEKKPEPTSYITFDDFSKLQLKVGVILHAEDLPKSKKLLKVTVDLGEEKPRQILAGISTWYKPEALAGRKVVVVANLKPRKMMGIESQGMMLAASDHEDRLCLVDVPDEIGPGGVVS